MCILASGKHSSVCLVILMITTFSLLTMPFIVTHVVVFNDRNGTHMLSEAPLAFIQYLTAVASDKHSFETPHGLVCVDMTINHVITM